MRLYETLTVHQRPTNFPHSAESTFFNRYAYLLSDNESWEKFLKPTDAFETIRANIILRALLNKMEIEKLFLGYIKASRAKSKKKIPLESWMEKGMEELPFLSFQGEKIYVPIFPISLNVLYSRDYSKLAVAPYKKLLSDYEAATIDPFDYYGYQIYDSYFTRLVAIRKTPKIMASYDYDAECLYFIDDEGRLDAKISFFDKELKTPVKTHMVKRAERVANAYFADDREALLKALVEENLISSSLVHSILRRQIKENNSFYKKKKDEE